MPSEPYAFPTTTVSLDGLEQARRMASHLHLIAEQFEIMLDQLDDVLRVMVVDGETSDQE